MYHVVFIHSSVKGHLSCFHVLPVVNSAAMNVVHTLFVLCFLSDVGTVRGPAGDRGHIHRGSWWWCPEGALYKNGKDLKETNKDSRTRENASYRKACKKVATSVLVHGIFQERILECVVVPSSRGSSQPRDQAQASHIAGGLFTVWATREACVLGTGKYYVPGTAVEVLRSCDRPAVQYYSTIIRGELNNRDEPQNN